MHEQEEMPQGNNTRKIKRPRRRKGRYRLLFLIVFLTILILPTIYGVKKFMPNFSTVSPEEFYSNLDFTQMHIVLEGNLLDIPTLPINIQDEIYLPVDFIKEYIYKYIFWDETVSKLIITTENEVMRMEIENLNYTVNNKAMKLQLPIYEENKLAFVPISLVLDFYNVSAVFDDTYNFLIIDYTDKEKHKGIVEAKKTRMRYEADKKSPIKEMLLKETELTLYEEFGDYTKVRTNQGLIGYVLTKDINPTELIPAEEIVSSVYKAPVGVEGKLNIAWEEMSKSLYDLAPEELDIIAPMWFSFHNEQGDIKSIADKDYIDFAREKGYKIWPIITDNFDPNLSYEILRNTDTREYIINQLLDIVSLYELDGINLDFEGVRERSAEYFIQFARELYPLMKERGVVLSADVAVPLYTRYYNRTEMEKALDYILIMAYDEHHSTSTVSGPVASIGFVETGVMQTLEEVPSEKVILGIPYYVRIWREVGDNGPDIPARSVGINYGYKIFYEQGVEFEWIEELGCYYGEYTVMENGVEVTYRTWLEDLKSIELKLELLEKYNLAGVAGWQKGLEPKEVWPLIEKYLK